MKLDGYRVEAVVDHGVTLELSQLKHVLASDHPLSS